MEQERDSSTTALVCLRSDGGVGLNEVDPKLHTLGGKF